MYFSIYIYNTKATYTIIGIVANTNTDDGAVFVHRYDKNLLYTKVSVYFDNT